MWRTNSSNENTKYIFGHKCLFNLTSVTTTINIWTDSLPKVRAHPLCSSLHRDGNLPESVSGELQAGSTLCLTEYHKGSNCLQLAWIEVLVLLLLRVNSCSGVDCTGWSRRTGILVICPLESWVESYPQTKIKFFYILRRGCPKKKRNETRPPITKYCRDKHQKGGKLI